MTMSTDGQYQLFDKDMPLLDAPAYVRRAREVEAAWSLLLERCEKERTALLAMPRMRLGVLFASLPSDAMLESLWQFPEQAAYLRHLHAEWRPQLRVKLKPVRAAAELKRPVANLITSFTRFNRRWLKALGDLDLRNINTLREDYNRYYLLEKECALRSARIAGEGFRPLEPVTTEHLLARFPMLQVPEPKELVAS
jgi:hypothetical protein